MSYNATYSYLGPKTSKNYGKNESIKMIFYYFEKNVINNIFQIY